MVRISQITRTNNRVLGSGGTISGADSQDHDQREPIMERDRRVTHTIGRKRILFNIDFIPKTPCEDES